MSAERSVVLCTGGYDHVIRFWEAPTGVCHRTLQYADSQINRLDITADKHYLAVAGNPHIRLYDTLSNSPTPLHSFDSHTHSVTAIGFQRDRKWMYSGSEDGTVKIWDIRSTICQRDYENRSPINTVALHPNQGELIVGDEDGNIRIWDLTANQCSYELVPDGKTPIRSIAIASDGTIVTAVTNKGTCFVWRFTPNNTFEALHKIEAHNTYALKCLLSPDVKYLATASADHTVKIWAVDRGFSLERTLTGHTAWVWDCAFSADSAYLVTGSSDKSARLWDVKSGEVIIEYKGHNKAVSAVALNDSS